MYNIKLSTNKYNLLDSYKFRLTINNIYIAIEDTFENCTSSLLAIQIYRVKSENKNIFLNLCFKLIKIYRKNNKNVPFPHRTREL